MQDKATQRYAFASFTFDAATGELRRNGGKLRLPEQNALLLTLLLERAGSVVTREELRRSMWPDGEYLDYDHSISNAVNQLRNILRDSSRAPAFIETLPKKGYRFIAEVETLAGQLAAPVLPVVETVPVTVETEPEPALEAVPAEPIVPVAKKRLWPYLLLLAGCLALAGVGGGWWYAYHRTVTAPAPGYLYIGIAPIEATGPNAGSLAESFRLDLADSLSQLPRMQVRADHSFSSTQQDAASIQNLAQTLQLDDLLYGKLTIDEQRNCTLQFELVRGRDAVHLGSFRYTGTIDQLAAMRDQVQRDVFQRLEMSVATGRRMPGSTENPRAYESYLEARSGILKPTDASLRRAVTDFQSALGEDPGFARAQSGLATAYVLEGEHGVISRDAAYRDAQAAAQRAVQLDSTLAEAHATLGFIAFRRNWDAVTAEHELKQAVTLEPGQAEHHILYAHVLGHTGRFHEALDEAARARSEDPLWPPAYLTEMYLASCAHEYARALDVAQQLVKLMPDWPLAYDERGWVYWYEGQYEQAVEDWHRMAVMEKDAARQRLEEQGAVALRTGGPRAYAELRLAAIRSGTAWAHPTDFLPAEWLLKAGDRPDALKAIAAMIAHRDLDSLELSVSPAFEDLHSDPQFLAMLRQAGLALPTVR